MATLGHQALQSVKEPTNDHSNNRYQCTQNLAMNVRKSKLQHITALADDIAAHGLIHNLVGYKNGKGYQVVAGGRRLEASLTDIAT